MEKGIKKKTFLVCSIQLLCCKFSLLDIHRWDGKEEKRLSYFVRPVVFNCSSVLIIMNSFFLILCCAVLGGYGVVSEEVPSGALGPQPLAEGAVDLMKPPPPPFVQSLIAAKLGPFAAFTKPMGPWIQPSPSTGGAGPSSAGTPAFAGIPSFLQGIMSAKASAAGPFGSSIVSGAGKKAGPPPDWIAQMIQAGIASKGTKPIFTLNPGVSPNAPAPGSESPPSSTVPMPGIPLFLQSLIAAKASAAGPFGGEVMGGVSSKNAPPPDWVPQMIQSSIAAKTGGAGSFPTSPSSSPNNETNTGNNTTQAKRDVSGAGTATTVKASSRPPPQPLPQPQAMTFPPFQPLFFAPPYPSVFASAVSPPQSPSPQPQSQAPSSPAEPMFYPMYMPSFMPFWKLG